MSNGNSFAHLGLYVGADWAVRCSTYDGRTPILSIDAGPTGISISPEGRDPRESAVEFARALVREVQVFAAEIEQLHDGQAALAELRHAAGKAA